MTARNLDSGARTSTRRGHVLCDAKGRARLFAASEDAALGGYALHRRFVVLTGDETRMLREHMARSGWSVRPAVVTISYPRHAPGAANRKDNR